MQIGSSNPASFSVVNATLPQPANKKSVSSGTEKPEKVEAAGKSNKAESKPSKDEHDPTQKRALNELQTRDREVRAHEAAHKAAGGGLVKGGASYSYERGPDGKLYAVGGEVSIDTSPVAGNPQATLQKANQIRAAALAPAQPSGQDRAVAAQAAVMASKARADASAARREETQQNQASNQEDNNTGNKTVTEQYQAVANGQHMPDNNTIDLMA